MIACFDLVVPAEGKGTLLDDVSFEIASGRWVECIGPSGAGKSVLFSILTLRRSTPRGRMLIAGRQLDRLDAADRAKLRRMIGSCAQPPRLLPERSVREHLVMPMIARRQRARAKQAADKLLEDVGLETWRDRPVRRLAAGERKALGCLRATVGSPDIIAIDGGLSGVGAELQALVTDRLRACWERGSLVFVFGRRTSGRAPPERVALRLQDGTLVRSSD